MKLKKEARQVNQKFTRRNIGSSTCIKSSGDKIGIPDSWIIYRLGDAVTSVLPLGRHTSTSPILLQGPPHKLPRHSCVHMNVQNMLYTHVP